MRILSLDLSLVHTGWALSDDNGYDCGSIVPKCVGWERIDHITACIEGLVIPDPEDATTWASLVVLEGPSLHSQGRGTCERWGLRGIVLHRLWTLGCPFVEVVPTTLKKYATGKGNANKDAMIGHAIRGFGFQGFDNNEADAWMLMKMAEAHYTKADEHAYRIAASAVVDWPEL